MKRITRSIRRRPKIHFIRSRRFNSAIDNIITDYFSSENTDMSISIKRPCYLFILCISLNGMAINAHPNDQSVSTVFPVKAMQINFQELPSVIPGVNYSSVAWGDYNGDSYLDLILSGKDGNSNFITKLYKNIQGQFIKIPGPFIGMVRSSIDWGDYDNDGDLDVVMIGETISHQYSTIVYKNDGNDHFSAMTVSLPGYDSGFVKWIDFDQDGALDIILGGYFGSVGTARLYRNEGDDVFGYMDALPSHAYRSLAFEDFNHDGRLDLYIISCGSQITPDQKSHIYQSDGNGIFSITTSNLRTFSSSPPSSITWADFDADGDLDYIIDGWFCALNRNLSFDELDRLFPSLDGACSIGGDLNGDGRDDNLVASRGEDTQHTATFILSYIGNRAFEKINTNLPTVRDGALAFGDYDNDSIPEILLCGYQAQFSRETTKLFKPLLTKPDAPPGLPQNLQSEIVENSVLLSWDPAWDAETPSGSLTYNIRVGTSSGQFNVVSPMADPSTGKRFVPSNGNAQQSRRYLLTGLAPGTYHWSVQAIDHSFAASPFAGEKTFTVSHVNRPPVIVSLPDSACFIDALYTCQILAEDPDRDTLTYSISTDIASLDMNLQSGLISGTPSYSELGIHQIIVTAKDARGGRDQQIFNLYVMDPNPLPENLPNPIISLSVGNRYYYENSFRQFGSYMEEIIGDTLIQDRSYAVVRSMDPNHFVYDPFAFILYPNSDSFCIPFRYYLRADSTRMYYYDQRSGTDLVLVDFSFPVGYEDPIFGYIFQKSPESIFSTDQFMIWGNSRSYMRKYSSTFGLISCSINSIPRSQGGTSLTGAIIDGVPFGEVDAINSDLNRSSGNTPSHPILRNNYPNPFNCTTHISFYITKSATTVISVYDVNGRQIQVIQNRFLQPGEYSLNWDARSLPSGMYFVHMTSGAEARAVKCLILK
jgi:hypothetical protein